METRVCKEGGQEKAAADFSKSYPNRCRECVAKAAREKRQEAKNKPEGLVCTQDPTYSPLPDFLDDGAKTARYWEEVWELRRYKLAKILFFKYLDSYGPSMAASNAKEAADKFINIMRDNDQ